jgi:hypothetical protein
MRPPDPSAMTKNTILKGGAGLAAAVALAVGGVAISSGSSNSSNSATAAQPGGNGTLRGAPPAAAPRGFGTPVTGTAATKAKAAALAKYPGTVERVVKAPTGGGYEVHVIRAGGSEVHVLVSATFQVTGTEAGGPPQGGTRPSLPQPSGSTT